jgi:hypothetical protein
LPKGFVKVRYFGFFSHGSRQRLDALRQSLDVTLPADPNEPIAEPEPVDSPIPCVVRCPICNRPMWRHPFIPPLPRSPPVSFLI